MKILVTGAAGLIGSHLCDILINKDHEVTGIDDLSYGNVRNLHSKINFIEDKVENIFKYEERYDVIYHLASLKKVWDGSIYSSDVMLTNFLMTDAITKKALRDGSKLIFASTSDIYGNSKTFLESDNLTMGPPGNRRYSYALSKWHSEQYILNTSLEEGALLKAVIVRVFGCASPRSNTSWSGGHVPLFIDLASNNEDILIHGEGLQTRSISHALDIAEGFSNCLDIKNEIINLGTDQQTTVKYVAEYIVNKLNSKSRIKYIPKEKIFKNYNEIMVRFANTDKAKKLINYKVNYTTEQVIDEIIKSL